jgi:hypothetical protein
MTSLDQRIREKYLAAGFQIKKESDDLIVFANNFSIHYIFLFPSQEDIMERYSRCRQVVKNDYLKAASAPDIYWNFYEVYVIQHTSNEFARFKEHVEVDFQMSRKYVLAATEIDVLPPLHLSFPEKKARTSESPWEEEWKNSVGTELYDKIIYSPKSKIEDVLREHLDDQLN